MWLQFRHRLDRVHPYCRVVNHTEAEVRDILLALEQIYRPSFPELNLSNGLGASTPGSLIPSSIHKKVGGCSWTT